MRPPGPYEDVSRGRQCTCFGYPFAAWNQQKYIECSKPMVCYMKNKNDPKIDVPTILPIDGTPCDHAKVCWGRQCVPLNE
ncbi:hypothetical protein PV328_000793 [Microctonus aethiopoides]|uniref:ADAMTS cysteine-rich domain-containing protein n=1 Tax=Microctonus aethiopoides TaxID=144406 RepID=A0AA39KWU0_9HYME|nr:hypothetical protein PV328_000793 [Microctonus aethiopoides]